MSLIETVATQLLDGIPASQAMETLMQVYQTEASLSSVMSRVRAAILDKGQRPPEYDDASLRALAGTNPEIHAFLNAPLREQYAIQRAHRTRAAWGPEAEQELAQLKLLPVNLDGFHLAKEETLNLKRQREGALLAKNDALLIVPDFAKLLGTVAAMLDTASPRDTFPRLILPLLLASGRRFAEIVNGRSTFAPAAHEQYTIFSGQLKKRRPQPPYSIPLLVPYSTFAKGLLALRQKQQNGKGVANLTNAQVTARCQSNVQRGLEAGALPGFPTTAHIHDLRSAYVAAVGALYVSPVSAPRMAMIVLGHEFLHDSLAYSHVRLEGVGGALAGSLGPLHID